MTISVRIPTIRPALNYTHFPTGSVNYSIDTLNIPAVVTTDALILRVNDTAIPPSV